MLQAMGEGKNVSDVISSRYGYLKIYIHLALPTIVNMGCFFVYSVIIG